MWRAMMVAVALSQVKDSVVVFEVSQVLFRLSRWENLEHAKEI